MNEKKKVLADANFVSKMDWEDKERKRFKVG